MPCDETETHLAVREALKIQGPVYLRLTRCELPPVYMSPPDFSLGKAIRLTQGGRRRDLCHRRHGDRGPRGRRPAQGIGDRSAGL